MPPPRNVSLNSFVFQANGLFVLLLLLQNKLLALDLLTSHLVLCIFSKVKINVKYGCKTNKLLFSPFPSFIQQKSSSVISQNAASVLGFFFCTCRVLIVLLSGNLLIHWTMDSAMQSFFFFPEGRILQCSCPCPCVHTIVYHEIRIEKNNLFSLLFHFNPGVREWGQNK